MDRDRLVALLQESQTPDTEKVKAATSELQKNFYNKPDSLILLIEVAVASEDPAISQLAAVQALRLVPKYWKKFELDRRQLITKALLEKCLKEAKASARHSLCRLVAALVAHDAEDTGIDGLFDSLVALNNPSKPVADREVGSFIIYALLDNDPTQFATFVTKLFDLFSHTIQDPDSADVRVNAVKGIGATLILIESDEDEPAIRAVQALFPKMVNILQQAIDDSNSDHYRDIFEVLQSFLADDPALLAQHLKDLIEFMIRIGANTEVDDEARSQALLFLAQCVQYRRMRIQGMKDVGAGLMRQAMKIVSEIEDDPEEDDFSPARTAISLVDQLANDLPPKQVILPLLDDFPSYANSPDPGYRKSGIICLGTACEGAPEFIATQLKPLVPLILQLLNDADENVRQAAVVGLMHIANEIEMAEVLSFKHEDLIESLLNNLQAASQRTDKGGARAIRAVCGALDSLGDSLEAEVAKSAGQKLIRPLGMLLGHDDLGVKAAAAGAIGAIAVSLGDDFKPYFEDVMKALGTYLMIKDSEDALALRCQVCDAMGRIATAVGAEAFQPYVMDLMKASEDGLSLDSARLKEASFLLWSSLAKLYELSFAEFLPGVFQSLLQSLELEEEEVSLDGLIDEPDGGEVLVVGGKKLKVKKASDEDADDMDDDGDDDWDDMSFGGATAVAMEQEVALEVLGDVITMSCDMAAIQKYLEPSLEKLLPLTSHSYEGCRKTAVSTLWRSYARVWQLQQGPTEQKWRPGPAKDHAVPEPLVKLGEMVCKATLDIWADESERTVVSEINRNAAAVLKTCGPAILGLDNMEMQMVTVIASIITRSHPCQQDLGDEEDEQNPVAGSSESDWLVIDTALDLSLGMAEALGPTFVNHLRVFQKPIMAFASSQEQVERSTAIGVIGETIKFIGSAVTPLTASLLPVLTKRLTDEDPLTKSNAIYAIGQLIANSEETEKTLPLYPAITEKLEAAGDSTDHRIPDNIVGCLSRMIIQNPTPQFVSEALPTVVNTLPLKDDYEENAPAFQCIYKLYELSNPMIQEATPRLMPVFEAVLGPPEDQLEQETRDLVLNLVRLLHRMKPEFFKDYPTLLQVVN